MTDRLIKLYELNEQYHDTKEKRAWLATTFYAAFGLAVLRWAIDQENACFIKNYQLYIIPLLGVIFLCVFFFNWFQYRKKRASVKIENFLEKELSTQQNEDNQYRLTRVFNFMQEVNKPWWKRTVKKPRCLSTEIQIFVLMGAFFFAQVLFILIASGTWPLIAK